MSQSYVQRVSESNINDVTNTYHYFLLLNLRNRKFDICALTKEDIQNVIFHGYSDNNKV